MSHTNRSRSQGYTIMKIIKVQIELAVDETLSNDKYLISEYLNDKLYIDPEFFGEFGPENIVEVTEVE